MDEVSPNISSDSAAQSSASDEAQYDWRHFPQADPSILGRRRPGTSKFAFTKEAMSVELTNSRQNPRFARPHRGKCLVDHLKLRANV